MILVPNIACIAGVFTLGFGIMVSVITNNVAAMARWPTACCPCGKSPKSKLRSGTSTS